MANLMNEREAAERLGIAVQTIRNMRAKGRGPNYVKVSRSVRYAPEEIDRYIEDRTVKLND
jgi:predicted DNA-binding transcriptional regulator AlpA